MARGDFIDNRRNAILIGNSGTGKNHLAMGIGQELFRRGYRVRFYTAAGLVNELMAAHEAHILVMNEDSYPFRESFTHTKDS